jgi:hypothetical protein
METVFPMGADGFREVSDGCRPCGHVKECLRTAASSPAGQKMKIERIEAMPSQGGGVAGFLSRWAELKAARNRSGH